MRNLSIRLLASGVLACAAMTVSADPGKNESGRGHGPPPGIPGPPAHARESYFHERGYGRLDIPPGHLPPPGECRAWFPERPPGHQPPPGACGQVPRGAWLIQHPHDRPGHVHVTAYERGFPERVRAIGEFEIDTGKFVRIILDR